MSTLTDNLRAVDVALGNVQGALNTDDEDRFAAARAELQSAISGLDCDQDSIEYQRVQEEAGNLNSESKQARSDAATGLGFALANFKQTLGDAAHEPHVGESSPSYTPAEVDNPPYPQPEGSQAVPVEGDTQEPVVDAEAAERKATDDSENDAEAARPVE